MDRVISLIVIDICTRVYIYDDVYILMLIISLEMILGGVSKCVIIWYDMVIHMVIHIL